MSRSTIRIVVGGLAISFIVGILLLPVNKTAPFVFSLTDGRAYRQQPAKIVKAGEVIKSLHVGDTPTSIDISKVGVRHLALVTSMEDSSISIVDLAEGELTRFHLPGGSRPRVSVWCDVIGDDREEIVVPLWGEGESSVVVGVLADDFEVDSYAQYTVGNRPRSVNCVDIDGDGLNDVMSVDNYSDTLSILRNTGEKLVLNQTINVASEPGAASIADFNNDGRSDIVVTHRGADNAHVLLQSASGGFRHALTLPTLDDPKDQFIADIDNDSDLDVVTIDGGSNTVSLFYLEELAISRVERISVSGSPHAMKYLPGPGPFGTIVVASYPNWLEVIRNCSGEYALDQSYWFGGFRKQKILYLDIDAQKPERAFSVMAGTNSIVESRIRTGACSQ